MNLVRRVSVLVSFAALLACGIALSDCGGRFNRLPATRESQPQPEPHLEAGAAAWETRIQLAGLAVGQTRGDCISRLALVAEIGVMAEWAEAGKQRALVRLDEDWSLQLEFEDRRVFAFHVVPSPAVSHIPIAECPAHLRPLILAIHSAPFPAGFVFDPLSLIRFVNLLQAAGRERAIESLMKYDELVRLKNIAPDGDPQDRDRLFLIARCLFSDRDRSDDSRSFLKLGVSTLDAPHDPRAWPDYPLAVVNDIPFMLVPDYSVVGAPPDPEKYLNHCRERCVFRRTSFAPQGSPLVAVDQLVASPQWKSFMSQSPNNRECARQTVFALRAQALRSVASVYPEWHADQVRSEKAWRHELGAKWENYVSAVQALGITWDSREQRFRRKQDN